MNDPKRFIDVANVLFKGYTHKSDRFLDELRAEWVRQVEKRFRRDPVGFAALDHFHILGMSEHKRNALLDAQIGQPVPVKHAFRQHYYPPATLQERSSKTQKVPI